MLNQRNLRYLISFLIFSLVFTVSVPMNSKASEKIEHIELPSDIDNQLDELISLLKEIDSQNIDLINIENNSNHQINQLSTEAKELYLDYKKMVLSGELDKLNEDLSEIELYISNESVYENDRISFNGSVAQAASASGIKISNSTINKLNEVTGWSGGIFGVAAALIKMKLGLSPTALTLLILAVGGLGMHAINSCNKNKKGILLSGNFIGPVTMPTGVVTCKPVK